jgi:inorganic triphosphatase YgiF
VKPLECHVHFFNRALEVRGEFCARLQRAGTSAIVIQTFHVWLPSTRRSAAETSDVSRLATLYSPLRGGNIRRFTSGYLLLAAPRRKHQTFHVWLPSTRRSAAEASDVSRLATLYSPLRGGNIRRFTSGYLLRAPPARKARENLSHSISNRVCCDALFFATRSTTVTCNV